MKRYELPTALCPKCQDFAFRIYKKRIGDDSHQCCNCKHIFKPKRSRETNIKERIEEIIDKISVGTPFGTVGLQNSMKDQATTNILKVVELKIEKLRKEYDRLDMVEEREKVIYNQAIDDIKERLV